MGDGVKDFQGLIDRTYSDLADRVVCDNYLSQEEGLSEEEREQRIKEYMSLHCVMDKCLYLCGETILECPEGFKKIILKSVDHNVYVDGQPARASTDCAADESAQPFGVCFKQSREEKKAVMCEPRFAYDKWFESCSKMKVGDADSVNENSYLICLSGGGVKVTPVFTASGIKDESEITEGLGIDTDIETQINNLIDLIGDNELSLYTYESMLDLNTVEILARMIYQEDHVPDNGRQNAIAFVVINRLCHGGHTLQDKSGEKKSNNVYGVVTSGSYNGKGNISEKAGQFESIYDNERARQNTLDGKHNAYWPPTKDTVDENEKEGWENAKRLAAITCIAVELYGEGEENLRGGIVKSGDESIRENIINFMEQQVDVRGEPIINNIDECRYFMAYLSATSDIKEKGMAPGGKAGNIFY